MLALFLYNTRLLLRSDGFLVKPIHHYYNLLLLFARKPRKGMRMCVHYVHGLSRNIDIYLISNFETRAKESPGEKDICIKMWVNNERKEERVILNGIVKLCTCKSTFNTAARQCDSSPF